MVNRHIFLVVGLMLSGIGHTPAAEIQLNFRQVPQEVLSEYVANDILMSYDENLSWQEMVVDLDQGSVYQHELGGMPDNGTNSNFFLGPPWQFLINAVPELAYDTFITMGGPTTATSYGWFVAGGAERLIPHLLEVKFDTEGINVAWAPNADLNIAPQEGFMTARLTFSKDAAGVLRYFASASDGTERIWQLPIIAGVIVPEPNSAMLGATALVAFGFADRRRVRTIA